MDIQQFIEEEVVRQGFRRGTTDWAQRVKWMREAWLWALTEQRPGRPITVDDILALGRGVERELNRQGFRKVGVRVGAHIPPNADRVPRLVAELVAEQDKLTPDEFYVRYEKIHPFLDGNGRSGKILHNWLKGTLHDPVLVKDYFGGGLP